MVARAKPNKEELTTPHAAAYCMNTSIQSTVVGGKFGCMIGLVKAAQRKCIINGMLKYK